jgi:hypothetical protein
LRQPYCEDAVLDARLEMRRLPLIDGAWTDSVVRPNRDVDRFDQIAIQIAERDIGKSVRRFEPSLVDRRNRLPAILPQLRHWLILSAERERPKHDRQPCGCQCHY